MYVKVTADRGMGTRKTYRDLRSLSFSPECDVTGTTMPVSEMSVTILTDDTIEVGSIIELFDDTDKKWCVMPVIYAERSDVGHVEVRAQSLLQRLDSCTLAPKMVEESWASTEIYLVFNEVFGSTRFEWPIHIDGSLNQIRVSGYFPKQTARVRLQWILMTIGATITDWWLDRDDSGDLQFGGIGNEPIVEYVYVRPVLDTVERIIPLEDTYWRPRITYRDYVTAIRVTVYEYEHRPPSRTEEYVEIKEDESQKTGDIWTQTSYVATLTNNDVPEDVYENVVEVDGITIINEDNVDDVMTHLARFHFTRNQIELEAINNFDYLPPERFFGYLSKHEVFIGYLNSCTFTFGKQAKASMILTPAEAREGAEVKVIYVWRDMTVAERSYMLPVGYTWTLSTEYVEIDWNKHHYILMPTIPTYTVPVVSGGTTLTIPMDVAVDRFEDSAYTRSVDRVNQGDNSLSLTGARRRS